MGGQGLRELKKRQTREVISHVATRLFIERGFDKVTIGEVAAAAGVAKMTVTNHFPRKEDLVFDVHEEFAIGLARIVTGRAPGESALAALRRSYFEALARRDAMAGFATRPFVRLVTGSPILLARLREMHEAREEALAVVLADESEEAEALRTRAAAAQLTAAYRVLFHEAFGRSLAGENEDEIAAALADTAAGVFDLLESGLGDYGRRDA